MIDCMTQQEEARLGALRAFEVLDTQPEEAFERIVRLAKALLMVPVAMISLVDRDRQWFKSRVGCDDSETPRSVSFCSHAIELDRPLIVPDARLDPRFANFSNVTGPPYIRFYLGVQLRNRDGFNIGSLCCIDTKPREPTPEQIARLQDLARVVMDELDLRLIATTDSLTGAMTRRAFLENARRDFSLAIRHRRKLSCLLMDADHFKKVNDTFGHAMGDEVLRRLVTVCRSRLRSSDYIGRLGGEEFAIILRETSVNEAFDVAERFRQSVGAEVFETAQGPFSITVSSGLAGIEASLSDVNELLERADSAMYQAKTKGRNRTVVYAQTTAAVA